MSAPALKLSAYVGERDRAGARLAADALLDAFEAHRVRVGVMLRGIEGFGSKHSLHTERLLTLSEDLPILAIAMDEPERIERLLPDVAAVCSKGLITLERALLGGLSGGGAGAPPGARARSSTDEATSAGAQAAEGVKLTVFLPRGARVAGRPAHVAVVETLREQGAWGASVLLGLDGLLAGARARARVLSRNARVPLMIMSVASSASAAAAASALDGLAGELPVALERVQVCKRDGALFGAPVPPPAQDDAGRAYWQKLVVYSSESARHGGQPLHEALVRRLRAEGAAGATSLRAQWGFHGEHAPHGERFLALERHVPLLTVVIDTPQRMRRLFEIVDELTARTGLVTSETVPALHGAGAGSAGERLRLAQARSTL